jgi:hypothetical protein
MALSNGIGVFAACGDVHGPGVVVMPGFRPVAAFARRRRRQDTKNNNEKRKATQDAMAKAKTALLAAGLLTTRLLQPPRDATTGCHRKQYHRLLGMLNVKKRARKFSEAHGNFL